MAKFFSRLNYSIGNEDWETEQRALQIRPDDRVVCITGSGDRALHCLLSDSAEVVAIDANPLQNHLLELKATALAQLECNDYLSFLGCQASNSREELLRTLAPSMHPRTASCWLSRLPMINRGILYQGRVERICQRASRVLRWLRGRKIDNLFGASDLDRQRRVVDEEWNSWLWRNTFKLALRPRFPLRRLTGDPGFWKDTEDGLHVGHFFYNRINRYLEQRLARESLLLSLVFLGKIGPAAYPPYLTRDGMAQIRHHLDRLSIETQPVADYLEHCPADSFDRFSLSDIASYMPEAAFHHLARAVVHAARPGARFSIRQFLSNHPLPPDLLPHFQREPELEAELEHGDNCFVYRYMVGTIQK